MAQEDLRKKCRDLYTRVSHANYAFIRKIDELIHAPEIEQLSSGLSGLSQEQKYKSFIDHQRRILDTVRGCEIQIFNDPRAFYVGKTYLNGVTGTMSTILTNGYLWLYNTLLEEHPELEINPDVDLRILLNLVGCIPIENGQLQMPAEEFQLLRSIIAKLLPRRTPGPNALFTPGWYQEYENTMNELENFLTANYRYYRFNQGRQKYGIETATNSFQDEEIVRRASERGYLPRYYDNWRLWETHPPYANMTNLFGGYTTDDTIAIVIPLLKTIFPPTATNQVNNNQNNNSNNNGNNNRNRNPNPSPGFNPNLNNPNLNNPNLNNPNPNNIHLPPANYPSGQVINEYHFANPGYLPINQLYPPATEPPSGQVVNEAYPPASVPTLEEQINSFNPPVPGASAVSGNHSIGLRGNMGALPANPPFSTPAQAAPNNRQQASSASIRQRRGGRSRRHKRQRKQRKLKTRRNIH